MDSSGKVLGFNTRLDSFLFRIAPNVESMSVGGMKIFHSKLHLVRLSQPSADPVSKSEFLGSMNCDKVDDVMDVCKGSWLMIEIQPDAELLLPFFSTASKTS